MKIEILNFGEAMPAQLEAFRMMPSFRKATRAMTLACASIANACNADPKTSTILQENASRFALVLGSAFGELETTKDFLKTFADTGAARPLLFQNSLHNSTSGFASIHFHLTGPVITVSHGLFSFEHSLEAANLLLQQRQADFVIVTFVETFLTDLASVENEPGRKSVDMSMSVLVTSNEALMREGLRSLGTIHDVFCRRKLKADFPTYSDTCYSESPAIERLRDEMKKSVLRHVSKCTAPTLNEFEMARSNQAESSFKWSHD